VFLPVKPEARETFRKMLSEIGEHIAREPNFVSALIHEDMDDPDTIVLYETWVGGREDLLEQLTRPYRQAYEKSLETMGLRLDADNQAREMESWLRTMGSACV